MRPMLDPALGALLRALRAEVGLLVVEEAISTSWASNTFEGGRHRVAIRLADAATAARLARELPDKEFDLKGHLVADVAEIEREGERLRFAVLTLVDAW